MAVILHLPPGDILVGSSLQATHAMLCLHRGEGKGMPLAGHPAEKSVVYFG